MYSIIIGFDVCIKPTNMSIMFQSLVTKLVLFLFIVIHNIFAAMLSLPNLWSEWVIVVLKPTQQLIVQLYDGENKLIFIEMMMRSAEY